MSPQRKVIADTIYDAGFGYKVPAIERMMLIAAA